MGRVISTDPFVDLNVCDKILKTKNYMSSGENITQIFAMTLLNFPIKLRLERLNTKNQKLFKTDVPIDRYSIV